MPNVIEMAKEAVLEARHVLSIEPTSDEQKRTHEGASVVLKTLEMWIQQAGRKTADKFTVLESIPHQIETLHKLIELHKSTFR